MRDFNHTVNVLVKAYLNDTLEHGNCYACAVGNIVSANNGYTYAPCWDRPSKRFALKENSNGSYFDGRVGAKWYEVIDDGVFSTPDELSNACLKEIESTGYFPMEIVKIERAFENASKGCSVDEWMFNGLMAVVDVLAEIHSIDLKAKEEAKAMFVKTNPL